MGKPKSKLLQKVHDSKFQKTIFIVMIGWVITYFILSMVIYAQFQPFSIESVWISSLGNPESNHSAQPVFNAGTFVTTFFFALHFVYLFHRVPIRDKAFQYFLQFLVYAGSVGFGAISIFTDNIQPIHDIMAGFAFGGLGLGYMFLDLHFLNLTSVKDLGARRRGYIRLIIVLSLAFLIVAVGVFIAGGVNYKQNSDWIIVWEWLAFFALCINIVVVYFIAEKIF